MARTFDLIYLVPEVTPCDQLPVHPSLDSFVSSAAHGAGEHHRAHRARAAQLLLEVERRRPHFQAHVIVEVATVALPGAAAAARRRPWSRPRRRPRRRRPRRRPNSPSAAARRQRAMLAARALPRTPRHRPAIRWPRSRNALSPPPRLRRHGCRRRPGRAFHPAASYSRRLGSTGDHLADIILDSPTVRRRHQRSGSTRPRVTPAPPCTPTAAATGRPSARSATCASTWAYGAKLRAPRAGTPHRRRSSCSPSKTSSRTGRAGFTVPGMPPMPTRPTTTRPRTASPTRADAQHLRDVFARRA